MEQLHMEHKEEAVDTEGVEVVVSLVVEDRVMSPVAEGMWNSGVLPCWAAEPRRLQLVLDDAADFFLALTSHNL